MEQPKKKLCATHGRKKKKQWLSLSERSDYPKGRARQEDDQKGGLFVMHKGSRLCPKQKKGLAVPS